jgi:F-type H+-transporting ATPase subunit a
MEISLFHAETTQPFARWGIEHILLALDTHTIFYTWIALVIIFLFAFLGRWSLNYPASRACMVTLAIIKSFKELVTQSVSTRDKAAQKRYYFFVGALFFFILTCNALVLIPGLEEPTGNLNTTFALAILSFLYVQRETWKAHGLLSYFQEYFKMPLTLQSPSNIVESIVWVFKALTNIIIGILSFPLEALSKVATILSLSLRLFGNIFGSSIIMGMFRQAATGTQFAKIGLLLSQYHIALGIIFTPLIVTFAAAISLVLNFGFGLIESLIQAFVFAILTLTYISLAIQHTSEEHHA